LPRTSSTFTQTSSPIEISSPTCLVNTSMALFPQMNAS
jgi:hypothetical protein